MWGWGLGDQLFTPVVKDDRSDREDDNESDACGDDNGQEGGIAFSFFGGWVVVGRLWLGHEVLDAGPPA
jgi:hypothetical protein